jgi:CRP/FNR family cyclic AMP-dependent transcriptional regulator
MSMREDRQGGIIAPSRQTATVMQIDKRHLLQRVWLFTNLETADLDLILPLTREQPCPAGWILVHQGDTSGDMFAVLQGRVKVVAQVDGEEVLLSIMGPGEVFGEIALLDGGARSATVTALETCRLLVLSRDAFRSLLFTVPTLGVRLLETLAKRIRTLTDRAESTSLRDVPARLAHATLGLAAQFGAPAGNGKIRVTVNLSQQELANLIGASREIVNRWLGRFSKQKLLRHHKGVLTILDEERLRRLAERPREDATRGRRGRSVRGAKRAS